jgi:hypothetical protein
MQGFKNKLERRFPIFPVAPAGRACSMPWDSGLRLAVKMIAEYFEHALQFERLAAEEKDARLKADLEKQAKAYRKLAAERASKLGLPSPPAKNPD